MGDCAATPDEDWVRYRFEGRCYFYPARDCPGWQPGALCGRMARRIPEARDGDGGGDG